jgi:hypothetical protein
MEHVSLYTPHQPPPADSAKLVRLPEVPTRQLVPPGAGGMVLLAQALPQQVEAGTRDGVGEPPTAGRGVGEVRKPHAVPLEALAHCSLLHV